MSEKNDKEEFSWEAGETLDNKKYNPVKEIHDAGFSKLANGIAADPVLRKEERKAQLQRPVLPKKKGEFFVEESQSGISEDFTPSEAARLIDKGSKGIKGISRFGKAEVSTSKKEEK